MLPNFKTCLLQIRSKGKDVHGKTFTKYSLVLLWCFAALLPCNRTHAHFFLTILQIISLVQKLFKFTGDFCVQVSAQDYVIVRHTLRNQSTKLGHSLLLECYHQMYIFYNLYVFLHTFYYQYVSFTYKGACGVPLIGF